MKRAGPVHRAIPPTRDGNGIGPVRRADFPFPARLSCKHFLTLLWLARLPRISGGRASPGGRADFLPYKQGLNPIPYGLRLPPIPYGGGAYGLPCLNPREWSVEAKTLDI